MEIDGTGMVRGTDYDGVNVGTTLGIDGDLIFDLGTLFTNGTYVFDLFAVTGTTSSDFDTVALTGAYGDFALINVLGVWGTTTNSGNQTWSFSQNTGDLTLDAVNFGNGATGLAAGTITVSGAVISGNMSFASGTGAVILNGGSISMPAQTTITLAGTAVRTINSVIGGASDGFSVVGTGILALNGLNTFGGHHQPRHRCLSRLQRCRRNLGRYAPHHR